MIINLSLPRRRESSKYKRFWIPAFAGMTFLEVAYLNNLWTRYERVAKEEVQEAR